MKVFVSDVLKDGVWEPWFVEQQVDFRTALQRMTVGIGSKNSHKYRVRRVKTLEELAEYLVMENVMGAFSVMNTDPRELEWL